MTQTHLTEVVHTCLCVFVGVCVFVCLCVTAVKAHTPLPVFLHRCHWAEPEKRSSVCVSQLRLWLENWIFLQPASQPEQY